MGCSSFSWVTSVDSPWLSSCGLLKLGALVDLEAHHICSNAGRPQPAFNPDYLSPDGHPQRRLKKLTGVSKELRSWRRLGEVFALRWGLWLFLLQVEWCPHPPNSCVEVLILSTLQCDLIWKKDLIDVSRLEVVILVCGGAPNPG